jgi:uncharacterized LabA/DUF88 family protein
MMKKKSNLYIDGTNLFAGQNDLFGPHHTLDFSYLIKEIGKIINIDQIFFYASYLNVINRKKSKFRELIAAEALFYREAKRQKNLIFFKGYRSPTSGKEKGVDVHLAVDIVKDAFLNNFREIVILTGDADLVYPMKIANDCGVYTKAIFLPNRFSAGIAHEVKKAYILNFKNIFKKNRKDPPHLTIVSIKNPRFIKKRGR